MTPVLVATSLLLFTTAVFYRRSWGIAFILMLLPAYLIRFELIGVPTTLLEFFLVILFAAWAFDLLRRHKSIGKAYCFVRDGLPRYLGWLMIFWVIAGLIATFWSADAIAGLGLWRAYILEPVLFALVFFFTLRQEPGLLAWSLRSLGIGVMIIGLVSILQLLGLVPSPLPWSEELPPRFASVFAFPNAVGLFVAPIVALYFGLLKSDGARENHPALTTAPGGEVAGRAERYFRWAVLFFGLVAITLAVSEGAILGVALALLLWALLSRRRKMWMAIGLVLLLLVFAFPQSREYVTTALTFSDTSGDVRLRLWQGTWEMLKANPITGAGMSGFPELYDQYRDAAHVELLQYPHNVLFNFWSEMGALGLLLFVLLVLRYYRNVIVVYRQAAGQEKVFALGLLLAMTALLGHGLVDVPYFKNDLAILFWTLFVLSEFLHARRSLGARSERGRGNPGNLASHVLRNVFNEDEEIIGQETHSTVHKEGLLHQEVHVFLYTKDGKVIFQKRSPKADSAPSLLDASAGGHVEVGETYEEAALHELAEETGVRALPEQLIPVTKYRGQHFDAVTGKTNNVFRMIYIMPYQGSLQDLRVEKGPGEGFEEWAITDLLAVPKTQAIRFVPTMLSQKYLEVYLKIQDLLQK